MRAPASTRKPDLLDALVAMSGPGFSVGISEKHLAAALEETVRGTSGEGAEAIYLCVTEIDHLHVESSLKRCCKCRGPAFHDALVRIPENSTFLCLKCARPALMKAASNGAA